MTESKKIKDLLRKVEALQRGATSDGERRAAAEAVARLKARLGGTADGSQRRPKILCDIQGDSFAEALFAALASHHGYTVRRVRTRKKIMRFLVEGDPDVLNRRVMPKFYILQARLVDRCSAELESVAAEAGIPPGLLELDLETVEDRWP